MLRRLAAVLLLVVAALIPASSASAGGGGSVVRVDGGLLQGTSSAGVRSFLGVPYAAPPVGDLRWRPPQPAARWPGVRSATAFGPHCAQPASPFGAATTSEDCLYLNVFAPARPLFGAPVMVWIHGGALTVGESDDYNPATLVSRGVVVVSLNYRLGALGFLAHPALTAESRQHASGNYGLLDQQAALHWVARNIAAFGGNPRNVTIFGESAGGLSVHSQLASPLAAGLFDRAVVESGAYQPVQATLANAQTAGSTFATQAGCTDQSAACLRALPVATILARQSGGAPNVDGYVLKQSIVDSFSSGAFNRVPVIEGSNHDEWRLFVAQTEAQTGVPLSAAAYIPAIAATLGISIDAATALAAKYPLSAYPSPSVALGALGTDVIFACNARRLAGLLSARVPTYQYEFNDPNAPMPFFPSVSFPTGAYHAAEIQYLFDSGTALDPAQRALSRSMVNFWTTFARFGTPFWPAYHTNSDRFEDLVPGGVHPATGFAADHKCA